MTIGEKIKKLLQTSGLLEVPAHGPSTAPDDLKSLRPRKVSIELLLEEYEAQEKQQAVTQEEAINVEGTAIPIEKIYDQMLKQKPAVSIDDAERMLKDENVRDLSDQDKQKVLLLLIKEKGGTVAEIVEDALNRDRVLDTFIATFQDRVETSKRTTEQTIGRIKDEISAIEQQLAEDIARLKREAQEKINRKKQETQELKQKQAQIEASLKATVKAKRSEERRLYDLVSVFVPREENRVTLDEDPEQKAVDLKKGEPQ